MIKIQFISVQTLKENSVIQANVNEKILGIAIREFQDIEFKNMIGRAEYLRLEGELLKLQAGVTQTLSPEDIILMEYVIPVMVYGSLMYSIPAIHTKFTDKGLQRDRDQNAEIGSPGETRADYAFKLDASKRSLLGYIHESKSSSASACATIEDTTFNFSGISLPDVSFDYEDQYRADYFKSSGGRRVIR